MCSIAGSKIKLNSSVLESLKLPVKSIDGNIPSEKQIPLSSDTLNNKIQKGIIPVNSYEAQPENQVLMIGGINFSGIKPLVKGMVLDEAKTIIKENKIDEIIFTDTKGKLYIVYGSQENKGSLPLENLKEGHRGRFGNGNVKILHINNETNTMKEGAKSPLKSTWSSIKEASATGITKGIAEMGTTIVAIFIGKSIVVNGMTAVQAATTTGTVAGAVIKNAGIVKEASGAGKAIVSTVTSGVKQVAVGAAIAGAVVGTVAVAMSAYGAYSGSHPKNDFQTIEMVTDPSLAFVMEGQEKPAEKKPAEEKLKQ